MTGVLSYFPRISYFQRIVQEGNVVIFPALPYNKRWQINRMVVPGSNGLINLSIPIAGGRNFKGRMDEVVIDNHYHWQRDHFRTLSSVYGRSPFFSFYADELKDLMDRPFVRLLDWNIACLQWIFQKMRCIEKIPVSYVVDDSLIQYQIQKDDHVTTPAPLIYTQVFEQNIGFQPDVSILDLFFNQGVKQTISIIGISA